jgi:hypothetical protein
MGMVQNGLLDVLRRGAVASEDEEKSALTKMHVVVRQF